MSAVKLKKMLYCCFLHWLISVNLSVLPFWIYSWFIQVIHCKAEVAVLSACGPWSQAYWSYWPENSSQLIKFSFSTIITQLYVW